MICCDQGIFKRHRVYVQNKFIRKLIKYYYSNRAVINFRQYLKNSLKNCYVVYEPDNHVHTHYGYIFQLYFSKNNEHEYVRGDTWLL
jgi:hypothetical protein